MSNIPYLSLHEQKLIISNKKNQYNLVNFYKALFPPPTSSVMDKYIKTRRSLNMQMRSMSLQSTSVKQIRREAAFRNKLKARKGDKEVVRRALTPPTRRPSLRWLNFQPAPSRLSNMSMASNEIVRPVCLVM